MATKDELELENAALRDEVAHLREQLADALAGKPPTRPVPTAPSFGMSEGTRADLEQVEETTDPFTGKKVTRDEVQEFLQDWDALRSQRGAK
jgi:hypothetical protein